MTDIKTLKETLWSGSNDSTFIAASGSYIAQSSSLADEEIRELKGKVEYYETVVDYLQEVVKSISNRSFQIKNAIEWRKFEAGI